MYLLGVSRASVGWWRAGGLSDSDWFSVYKPKGAASLADSLKNLINPATYTLTQGGAGATLGADGWEFASTAHLKTGLAATNSVKGIALRFKSILSASATVCGAAYNGGYSTYRFMVDKQSASWAYFYRGVTGGTPVAWGGDTDATLILTDTKAFVNTTSAILGSSSNFPGNEFYIGAMNYNSSPLNHCTCKIVCIGFLKSSINDATALSIQSAMAAL